MQQSYVHVYNIIIYSTIFDIHTCFILHTFDTHTHTHIHTSMCRFSSFQLVMSRFINAFTLSPCLVSVFSVVPRYVSRCLNLLLLPMCLSLCKRMSFSVSYFKFVRFLKRFSKVVTSYPLLELGFLINLLLSLFYLIFINIFFSHLVVLILYFLCSFFFLFIRKYVSDTNLRAYMSILPKFLFFLRT